MRRPIRLRGFILAALALAALAAPPARGIGTMRIEGNFELNGEIRRDADAEYGDRQEAFVHPTSQNRGKRPGYNIEFDRKFELRAYAYPASPIEVFAKVIQTNDFFLDEAHTRLRFERQEEGIESYLYYRQGRLGVGDPLITIARDNANQDRGTGLANNWWLRRGHLTNDSGQWSGEFNFHNTNEVNTTTGEDNEAYALKLRHDQRVRSNLTWAAEGLYGRKNFTAPTARMQFNQILGGDLTATWRDATFAAELLVSKAHNAPSKRRNQAVALEVRNLTLIDRPRIGRIGTNLTINRWGENYRNFIGASPDQDDKSTFIEAVGGGIQFADRAPVGRKFTGELFWDLARYATRLKLKYERRVARGDLLLEGQAIDTTIFQGSSGYWTGAMPLSERKELEVRAGLRGGMDLRLQYARTNVFGVAGLADFDAGRFIGLDPAGPRALFSNSPTRREDDLFVSLVRNRPKLDLRLDYRYLQTNVNLRRQIAAAEATYRVSPKAYFLVRQMFLWVNQPQNHFAVTQRSNDLGGLRTSVVEPFHRRHSTAVQFRYQPTDNSALFIEYGQGFHGDGDLAFDGDFLFPGRRTDDRIFFKMEMWF